MDVIAIDQQGGKGNCCYIENIMPTLLSDSHGTPHALCHEAGQCWAMSERQISMMCTEDVSNSVLSSDHKGPQVVCYAIENHTSDFTTIVVGSTNSNAAILNDGTVPTLMGIRGQHQDLPFIVLNSSGNGISTPLDASHYKGQGEREGIERECVMTGCNWDGEQVTGTLTANNAGGSQRMPDKENFNAVIQKTTGSLCAAGYQKLGTQEAKNGMFVCDPKNEKKPRKYVLRRLTPTECARLQGFPDWWVDGAEGSDSAIYKMWGNGIALPCAYDVLNRIAKFKKESEETNNEGI